jgi:predicted kinase
MRSYKNLVLVRGAVGSGKTEFARTIAPHSSIAADDYFERNGEFDKTKLGEAHSECQARALMLMNSGERVIAVHNTFVENQHMLPYFKLAQKYGYTVRVVTMNGHYGNTHKVPQYVIQRHKDHWEELDPEMVRAYKPEV